MSNSNSEAVLLKYKEYLSKDITLYTLYIQLGYIPETGQFQQPPDKHFTLEQIRKLYHFENPNTSGNASTDGTEFDDRSLNMIWGVEDLLTPRKYSISEEAITPVVSRTPTPVVARNSRGLRALSLRVRDLLFSKKVTTYKEVS